MQIGTSWESRGQRGALPSRCFILHAGNSGPADGFLAISNCPRRKPVSWPMLGGKGIVGHNIAMALVVVGIFMGFALIMVQVRSPMLFGWACTSNLETTVRDLPGRRLPRITDTLARAPRLQRRSKARVENAGVLTGLRTDAGEALTGLALAACQFWERQAAGNLQNRRTCCWVSVCWRSWRST